MLLSDSDPDSDSFNNPLTSNRSVTLIDTHFWLQGLPFRHNERGQADQTSNWAQRASKYIPSPVSRSSIRIASTGRDDHSNYGRGLGGTVRVHQDRERQRVRYREGGHALDELEYGMISSPWEGFGKFDSFRYVTALFYDVRKSGAVGPVFPIKYGYQHTRLPELPGVETFNYGIKHKITIGNVDGFPTGDRSDEESPFRFPKEDFSVPEANWSGAHWRTAIDVDLTGYHDHETVDDEQYAHFANPEETTLSRRWSLYRSLYMFGYSNVWPRRIPDKAVYIGVDAGSRGPNPIDFERQFKIDLAAAWDNLPNERKARYSHGVIPDRRFIADTTFESPIPFYEGELARMSIPQSVTGKVSLHLTNTDIDKVPTTRKASLYRTYSATRESAELLESGNAAWCPILPDHQDKIQKFTCQNVIDFKEIHDSGLLTTFNKHVHIRIGTSQTSKLADLLRETKMDKHILEYMCKYSSENRLYTQVMDESHRDMNVAVQGRDRAQAGAGTTSESYRVNEGIVESVRIRAWPRQFDFNYVDDVPPDLATTAEKWPVDPIAYIRDEIKDFQEDEYSDYSEITYEDAVNMECPDQRAIAKSITRTQYAEKLQYSLQRCADYRRSVRSPDGTLALETVNTCMERVLSALDRSMRQALATIEASQPGSDITVYYFNPDTGELDRSHVLRANCRSIDASTGIAKKKYSGFDKKAYPLNYENHNQEDMLRFWDFIRSQVFWNKFKNFYYPENHSNEYIRSFKDIVEGKKAYSEVIGYKVCKYMILDGEVQDIEPLQEFYMMDCSEIREIDFYDTQIVFGLSYMYRIYAINMVFGSRYQYDKAYLRGWGGFGTGGHASHGDSNADGSVLVGHNLRGPSISRWQQGPGSNPLPHKKNIDARLVVNTYPFFTIVETPFMEKYVKVVDRPPLFPQVTFLPYQGIADKLRVMMHANYGQYSAVPIGILESDEEIMNTMQESAARQMHDNPAYPHDGKVNYKHDSIPTHYQIMRLGKPRNVETAPYSWPPNRYEDFKYSQYVAEIPTSGMCAFFEEDVTTGFMPDTEYYYIFRAKDDQGISNPTEVFRVKMATYENGTFMDMRTHELTPEIDKRSITFERLLEIRPSLKYRQIKFRNDPNTPPDPDGVRLGRPFPDAFGLEREHTPLYGRKFKMRITSKTSGRKMDIHFSFKTGNSVVPIQVGAPDRVVQGDPRWRPPPEKETPCGTSSKVRSAIEYRDELFSEDDE